MVALVEAITPRYRTAVLIAAWCGSRRGEIAGLRVSDVDLTEHTITVRKNRVEPLHAPGRAHDKDPKTEAGKRTIAIPPHVIPVIRLHLDEYAGKERLFISRDGSPLRGNALYQAFVRARKRVGLDKLRFHDLRHTGQTLAAQTGATMADLMKRLGQSSMAAARRCLHAVDAGTRRSPRPYPCWPHTVTPRVCHNPSPCSGDDDMPLKVRERIRMIESDGWELVATRGSHRQYKHPSKPGRVTIAGNRAETCRPAWSEAS